MPLEQAYYDVQSNKQQVAKNKETSGKLLVGKNSLKESSESQESVWKWISLVKTWCQNCQNQSRLAREQLPRPFQVKTILILFLIDDNRKLFHNSDLLMSMCPAYINSLQWPVILNSALWIICTIMPTSSLVSTQVTFVLSSISQL